MTSGSGSGRRRYSQDSLDYIAKELFTRFSCIADTNHLPWTTAYLPSPPSTRLSEYELSGPIEARFGSLGRGSLSIFQWCEGRCDWFGLETYFDASSTSLMFSSPTVHNLPAHVLSSFVKVPQLMSISEEIACSSLALICPEPSIRVIPQQRVNVWTKV